MQQEYSPYRQTAPSVSTADPHRVPLHVSDGELNTKDFLGMVMGIIITLGPLAATALLN